MPDQETAELKVAIIGTGAMGSLFAALLAPFAEIVMIGSWEAQLQAVADSGLTVQHLDGSKKLHRIRATPRPAEAFPSDIALIVVKGWQTAKAADLAGVALGPDGLAITLQNGLGNYEVLVEILGSGRVVQGVTSEGATMIAPGWVRHAGHGHTYLARSEAKNLRLESTAALFRQAGFATTIVDNAQSLIWGKLVVNAGINPLTALLQVPNGHLLQESHVLDIMTMAVREVAAVANELGVGLPYDDPVAQTISVAQATAKNRSSMAQDISRGMPTEIEQISGAVVRYGRSLAIPVPMNEALLYLVRALVDHGTWHDAIQRLPTDLQQGFRVLAKLESG